MKDYTNEKEYKVELSNTGWNDETGYEASSFMDWAKTSPILTDEDFQECIIDAFYRDLDITDGMLYQDAILWTLDYFDEDGEIIKTQELFLTRAEVAEALGLDDDDDDDDEE